MLIQTNSMKSFTPLILIAICIAAFFFYIKPQYDVVQTLSAKKSAYTDVLQKVQEINSQRDAVLAQYNSVSPDDISRLKKAVPDQFDSVLLAKYINTVTANHGMVVSGIKFTEQKQDTREKVAVPQSNQYRTVYGSFTATGNYDQFLKLLKDLEDGLYLVDVTGLSLHGESKTTSSSSYDYSIDFQTYSLR